MTIVNVAKESYFCTNAKIWCDKVVKQVPVAENRERDETIIKMVIDLAKNINMTVVQEGVETKEMFDKVTDMGCDVVQGYYYAKAISLEEFKIFINTNTSIKYKSLVK